MAERLRSISRQIHWSLLLKAAIFALAWFFLPFWLFFLIALCLYFFPFFEVSRLATPFIALLILTFIEPPNIVFLVVFAALFYYLLLIKNLLLIDRKIAYEILIITLSFFFIRGFYERMGNAIGGVDLVYAFLLAALLGILIGSFMKVFSTDPKQRSIRRIGAWFSFLIFWQILIAGLFLPVDFIYQSVLVFLVGILVIDLVPEHCLNGVSRSRVLSTAMTVGALVALVLAAAF